jgi:DNA-binding SARP family transcriptional activator/WD40 repeat protein
MSTDEASIHRQSAFSALSGSRDATLCLQCFGPACVVATEGPAVPVTVVTLGKPLAVLAYLHLSPGGAATRERLTDLLWGDQDRAAARHSLRNALSYLRGRVGEWVISADDHVCTVSDKLRSDVAEFLRAVEGRDYAAVLTAYRGEFLAGFASPGCREFELWADIERSRLRALAVRVAEASWLQSMDGGRFAEARAIARRTKELDPESQLGWRLSLEVAIASGERFAALAEAEAFEAWLAADSRNAESELLATLRRARREHLDRPHVQPAGERLTPDFVGREQEFAAILEQWRNARGGKHRMIHVSAPAGLGKTRLLDAVATRAGAMSQSTITVKAFSGERQLPSSFAGALAHALGQLPGAIGTMESVVPVLIQLDPRLGEVFRASVHRSTSLTTVAQRAMALRELLAAVCEESPLLVLIDDMQWIDDESRQIVSGSLARLDDSRLLVVGATRSLSSEIQSERAGVPLSLRPLERGHVEALIASVAALEPGVDADQMVTHVVTVSRGVPLLVLEAIEQLIAARAAEVSDGVWRIQMSRLAGRHDAINPLHTRLRTLSPTALTALLRCASAGVPVPRSAILGQLSQTPAECDAIDELERIGYLVDAGDGRVSVHDAVADAARSVAGEAATNAAAVEMGRTLVRSTDERWWMTGARLLVDVGAVDDATSGIVEHARTSLLVSGLPAIEFVARAVSRPAHDPLVRAIARKIPLRVRLNAARRTIASIAIAAFGILVAVYLAGGRVAEEAALVRIDLSGTSGSRGVAAIILKQSDWVAGTPLTVDFIPGGGDSQWPPVGAVTRSVDGAAAVEVISPDSGGVDVSLRLPGGATRRLTRSRADEIPASWSPDGRQLAVMTSAFNPLGFKTLGILDETTGVVRPIGPRDRAVYGAAWSPDGTRIAYGSSDFDAGQVVICTIGVGSMNPKCALNGERPSAVVGWTGANQLLIISGNRGSLRQLDVRTMTTTDLGIESVVWASMSPDGRWLLFEQSRPAGSAVFAAPATEPSRMRPIVGPGIASYKAAFRWVPRPWRNDYLDAVEIVSRNPVLYLGAPSRLQVRGRSALGHAMEVTESQWRSLTPDIATVDSSGVVTSLKKGVAIIEVSAGGWRSGRVSLPVTEDSSTVILTERWDHPLTDQWVPFGHPYPRIEQHRQFGRAFVNNGDGDFFSGAYLRTVLYGTRGTVLETDVSVPITRPVHQYLEIGFRGVHNLDQLRRWNHLTGYLPSEISGNDNSYCGVVYPAHEGTAGALSLNPLGTLTLRNGEQTPAIARGEATHIQIAVLPDGRCAVLVAGERLYVAREPMNPADTLLLVVQGNSVGTRMAVGPITLKSGVPIGFPWRDSRP